MNEEERYVLGPISDCDDLSEDGNQLWQAEVQTMGGYGVAATIYAGTEDAARQMAEQAIAAWNTRASLQGVNTVSEAMIEAGEAGELAELLDLAGDYGADIFNDFPDKTSACARRVEANVNRFNEVRDRLIARAAAPTAPVQDDDAKRTFAELQHWFFQKLASEQREMFLVACGFPKGLSLSIQMQALRSVAARLSADHTGVPRQ